MKVTNCYLVSMGLLLAVSLLGSHSVGAAVAGTEDSKANFELKAGGDIPPEIIDPEVKPPLPNTGPLTINAVSGFQFLAKTIGTESQAPIEATPVEGTKLGVQVTDSRGQDLGWNLKVKATEFETVDKAIKLKGASMKIPAGKLITLAGVDPLLTPTAHAVTLSTSPESIMSATTTQGRSSWMNLFEGNNEKVTLDVPSGNKVASYVSTLTWSLEDAP